MSYYRFSCLNYLWSRVSTSTQTAYPIVKVSFLDLFFSTTLALLMISFFHTLEITVQDLRVVDDTKRLLLNANTLQNFSRLFFTVLMLITPQVALRKFQI